LLNETKMLWCKPIDAPSNTNTNLFACTGESLDLRWVIRSLVSH